MFRLYQQAFLAALEDWGNLSKKLQTEKETIQTIMNSMSQAWVGETQSDNENILRDMITTGLYQQTAEIVEKVYRLQYNEMPNIIAQMARCEKMGEQLLQDSHLSPYIAGFGYYNDGYLTLDDNYVGDFNCAVTEVLELAGEARSIVYEAMNACDGMIDFSEEREMLEAGYRKVLRIQNFSVEFNTYVREVKAIEEALTSGFRTIIAEDSDPTNRKWNMVLQNLREHKNIGYSIMQLRTTRTTAGFSTMNEPIEELDIEQVEIILQKPVTDWTQLEAEQVAHAYTQAIENRDVDMLNAIAEGLLTEENTVETTCAQIGDMEDISYHGKYSAGLDYQKCNALLTYIDPIEQGEAYFTLTRLRNYTFEKEVHEYDYQYGEYDTKITFSADKKGNLTANVTTECAHPNVYPTFVEFETSNLYLEMSGETRMCMESKNFSEEDIVNILSLVCTDTDKEFVYGLMGSDEKEEYQEVFQTRPNWLSVSGQSALAAYVYCIYDNSFSVDENGVIHTNDTSGFKQLTDLVNGITLINGGDKTFTQEYLSMITVCMEDMLNTNSILIYNNYENVPEEMIINQHKYYNIYALFASLEKMDLQYRDTTKHTPFSVFSDRGFEISNLELDREVSHTKTGQELDSTMFSYKYSIVGWDGENGEKNVTLQEKLPDERDNCQALIDYNKATKEWRQSGNKAAINAVLSIMSSKCPYIDLAISGYKLKDGIGELSGVIDGVEGVVDNDDLSDGFMLSSKLVGFYAEIAEAYEKKQEAYSQILSDWYTSGVYINCGADSDMVAEGMYNPEIIAKKAALYEEGFSLFCANEESVAYGNLKKVVFRSDSIMLEDKCILDCENVTIVSRAGSTGQQYAEKYGIPWEELKE